MEIFLEDFSFGRLVAFLVAAAFLFLFCYCLYDVVTSEFPGNEGFLWALIVFFAPGVGVFAYLIFGKQRKLKIKIIT